MYLLKPVRNNMKHNTKTTLFLLLALVISGGMFAQDEYYRVYQFETPCKGHLEVTNWTTFVGKSSGDYEHYGKTYSRESLLASSLELEYGVTDHFVLAGYADFDDPQNGHFN